MASFDSEMAAGESFPEGYGVAANKKNASVSPPTPANGIVGASTPLRPVDDVTDGKLVDAAHSCPDRKPVAHASVFTA
jgi:hypothetical protein